MSVSFANSGEAIRIRCLKVQSLERYGFASICSRCFALKKISQKPYRKKITAQNQIEKYRIFSVLNVRFSLRLIPSLFFLRTVTFHFLDQKTTNLTRFFESMNLKNTRNTQTLFHFLNSQKQQSSTSKPHATKKNKIQKQITHFSAFTIQQIQTASDIVFFSSVI